MKTFNAKQVSDKSVGGTSTAGYGSKLNGPKLNVKTISDAKSELLAVSSNNKENGKTNGNIAEVVVLADTIIGKLNDFISKVQKL